MNFSFFLNSFLNFLLFVVEEIVALKRLKMEKEREGFPITSLREINTLLKAQHPNIVTVRVSDALWIGMGSGGVIAYQGVRNVSFSENFASVLNG